MSEWQKVESAPTDGREVLAAFRGQFSWVMFIALAHPLSHGGLRADRYAKPTHWMPLPEPPEALEQQAAAVRK